ISGQKDSFDFEIIRIGAYIAEKSTIIKPYKTKPYETKLYETELYKTEFYEMMEDYYNNYFNKFNYEIAKSSETSMEAFLLSTIRPNIQISSNFSTPSESKNKGNKISMRF
ncbi:21869_t:CDS:2, partial [Dentiscutata erythropus]